MAHGSKRSVLNAFSSLRLGSGKPKAASRSQNLFDVLGETARDASAETPVAQTTRLCSSKPILAKQSENVQGNGDPTVEDADNWIDVKKKATTLKYPEPAAPIFGRTNRSNKNHLTDTNWRERNPEAQKARYENARTVGKSRYTFNSRMTHTPGPRTIGGILFADQVPGVLFWHWDIRPCVSNAQPLGWQTLTTPDGKHSMKKGRYWIIVDVDGETVSEVAIYTNHNTGLRHLHKNEKDDYCSLRPMHISAAGFKNQNPRNPVLEVQWMQDKQNHVEGKLVRDTMVVNWKEVKKRNINIPDLRMVGAISDESTSVLRGGVLRRRC